MIKNHKKFRTKSKERLESNLDQSLNFYQEPQYYRYSD